MGHGFGLPHTDEDFNNADLGNCLDYTENWGANKSPDASNYDKLAEFYGVVSGRRQLVRGGRVVPTPPSEQTKTIPDSVMQRREEALANLEFHDYSHFHEGWRMLHQTMHGQEHILDLGEGYKLQVQMLLRP